MSLSVYYYCFSLSLSQFLPIFLSFVAISAVLCRLSEFYLKRAFFIPYLPLLKNSQPVCPDDFMGPQFLINCVFKLKINLY